MKTEPVKPIEKPSALETMLVTIIDKNHNTMNHIVPNFDVKTINDKETMDLVLFTEIPGLKKQSLYSVFVMATKDPTPCDAIGSVSLSYLKKSWSILNARCLSTDPPIFRGWQAFFKSHLLLEMWDYDKGD